MKSRHSKKLDKIALEMISHSYFFKREASSVPNIPEIQSNLSLGMCRVVGVVINETSSPELLLLESGANHPDFYNMEELQISLVLDSTG